MDIYLAEASDVNKRIDHYLNEELEDLSRSALQKLIDNGNITVNGKAVNKNYKLRKGDTIEAEIPEPEGINIEAENIPLDILYEDGDLIVVNKPQNMVVHPAPGHYRGTLVNALMYHCGDNLSGINGVLRPGIVHRIDKDTSGVLVIAKSDLAHRGLSEQLTEHSMNRIYNAIVYNGFDEDEGTVNTLIGRSQNDRKKMAVLNSGGRNAVTHYKVIERMGKFTLVELKLETGRTHQIRVHMAHIGHPLLGDSVYGPKKQIFNLQGQVLHAKVLGFVHPRSGEYMEFSTELPEYFNKLIGLLKNKG
ncbi:MAG: RluA family pseudouridine synthase [Clostridia bacterium]|nr:RluA family pseudouridine synthase [Clostridia bacterium]